MLKLFICISIVLLVLIARKPRPATNQQGEGITSPQNWADEPELLTVATFNIQTGKDINYKRDISRASAAIVDAHILGVQEVYAHSWLNQLKIGEAQASALAKTGGFGHLFSATAWRWFRENRGNALLSKLPIKSWEIRMLVDESKRRYRNMTIAHFTWHNEPVVFINTHLHTKIGQQQQLKQVLDEFANHRTAILVGDFNCNADTPLIQELLADGRADNTVTDAIKEAGLAIGQADRIDWILTKGFTIDGGSMIEKGISDHPYYQVNLRLNNKI